MKWSPLLATSISLMSCSMVPSIAVAQLSEEQEYTLSLGLTAGSLKTVCVFHQEGVLSEQQTKDYAIGYLESIKDREKGASLAGAMRGYETAKKQHPSCPLP